MPELIIKGVEGLNLVSSLVGTVNGTENVGFAKWLGTVLLDS